jgi:uncharacterized protein with gpF-like domain
MRHLRKFEDIDYKDKLASEMKARQEFEKSEEERIEKLRKDNSNKYRSEFESSKKRHSSDVEMERTRIVQKVIDGLVADLNNNPGYQSFKEELLSFLDEFPKE